MIEQPSDDAEVKFACMFAARLVKRHAFNTPEPLERQRITHQPGIVELEYQDSVELAVAEFYNKTDATGHCFYVENSLFNGVLGLLIWGVVFAPLAGVFFNPFQLQFSPHLFPVPRFAGVTKARCLLFGASDQWIMRLHHRDGKPTDYQAILDFSFLPLPVSLPVGAWFVPES